MRSLAWLVAGFVLSCVSVRASAEEPEAHRRLIEGSRLFEAGQYAEALHEFEVGRQLEPLPALDYGVARSLELLGRPLPAATAWERYLTDAPTAADRGSVRARIQALRSTPATSPSPVPS